MFTLPAAESDDELRLIVGVVEWIGDGLANALTVTGNIADDPATENGTCADLPATIYGVW